MLNRQRHNQNNFNSFLNHYFNVVILMVLVISFIVAYFVVLYPKFKSTLTILKSNVAQQQMLYTRQQTRLNDLKVLNSLYKKINLKDLDKFNKVLPKQYTKERLYGELEEIVGSSGFMLNEVKILKDKDEEENVRSSIGEVNLSIDIGAINYSGLKNILNILEKNSRLFDVNAVSFSPEDESATIKLTTYYFKNK